MNVKRNIPYIVAVACGVLYGIISQLTIRRNAFQDFYLTMSIGFVFVYPLVLGFITIFFLRKSSWLAWIFLPWLTFLVSLVVALAVGWEGSICVIMFSVLGLPLASLGGLFAVLTLKYTQKTNLGFVALGIVFISPFASGFLEHRFDLPKEMREVKTQIRIAAPKEIVWQQVIRVPEITEPQESLFFTMGFPKPVEASLSQEGVGGVRTARFEKGLVFVETITDWEPEKKLSFEIRADPKNTPLTTLDPHVTVGGRYFDVLQGTFQIEELSSGEVILHLKSETRLSTRFNLYARMWSDFLMGDIQKNILRVLKTRSEGVPKV